MDQTCHVEPINKTALDSVIRNADNILLAVSGMGCQNCATRVQNGLLMLDGVFHVEINLGMGMAEVFYDAKIHSVDDLIGAVSGAGNDGRHHYCAEIAPIQTF